VPGQTAQPAAPGPVALVGSGEYLDAMVEVDRRLLSGRPQRAVFLPTAAAEEGNERIEYWLELGRSHFERLGVEAVPLPVLTRQDADDGSLAAQVAGAGLVYLSGGNPGYLAATLRETPVWAAIRAAWLGGAALAGCSAGACALTYVAEDVRSRRRAAAEGGGSAAGAGGVMSEPSGLAVVPDVAVIPHFDRMLGWAPQMVGEYLARVPDSVTVVGVDEDTAVVTGGAAEGLRAFSVAGRQSAWVLRPDGTRTEHPTGSSFEVAAAG
jgi:cyanophycinase